jgi:hypothetical protein
MVRAYLRDPSLVPPGYPNGLKSLVRQETILEWMALELRGEDELRTHSMLSSILSAMNTPEGRRGALKDIQSADTIISACIRHDLRAVKLFNPDGEVSKLREVYEVLSKHNIVGPGAKVLTKEEIYEIIEDAEKRNAEKQKTKK